MLSSVLHVLAIIGIVLLCILGVLLLLILAVLFAPIRYRLFVEKEDGWKKENIRIRADVGWLAGFIRVKVRLFDPQVLKVKVLFFTVFDLFKEKKEKKQKKKRQAGKKPPEKKSSREETKKETAAPKKQQETTKETATEESSQPEKADSGEANSTSRDNIEQPETQSQEREQETGEKKKSSSLKERLEKIRYTIRTIYDKIKTTKDTAGYYLELLQSEECKSVLAYVIGKAGKLLRHILPQKIKGTLLFGTGQPDQTGYILGVISIIRGIRGYDKFNIEADFERQIVEGKIQCKGRIRLATVGILALQVYRNKELRELISKLKREEN